MTTTTTLFLPAVPGFLMEAALRAVADCAASFLRARDYGILQFDDQIEAIGLHLLSQMVNQAAKADERRRKVIFRHWVEHGPARCEGFIRDIAGRDGVLTAQDLSMFLQKEKDGPVF
jgi:hypothetical protein